MRVCSQPGCGVLVKSAGYCATHRREHERRRGTRQQRGYDADHDRLRRQWAPRVRRGVVQCAKCGEFITAGSEWHLGHTDDRTAWTGPEHTACNLSAAGRASHGR